MPRYAITERAGPFVAAHRNTGVGTVLVLSEHQAEHELQLGSLVRLPVATKALSEPPADRRESFDRPHAEGALSVPEKPAVVSVSSRKLTRSAT